MTRAIDDLLTDRSTTIAVVGATDSPGKYGGEVYRNLKAKGFGVLAIHPTADTVDGDPAWATLDELPVAPDIVTLVVPAPVGEAVIAAASTPPRFVWMQPGAEGEHLLGRLASAGIGHMADRCIMVATAGMSRDHEE